MVPLTIWLIISGEFIWAFVVFLAAGISDGVDGFLARRYKLKTELGSYLDPLADKLLLVSIYVALGFLQFLPAWLVILVASRDVLIVGAIMLSLVMGKPVTMHPLMISKINTVGQIILAGAVLAVLGLGFQLEPLLTIGTVIVAGLTVSSGALYMQQWVHHMANGHIGPRP
jgi:cardiolipin synthase